MILQLGHNQLQRLPACVGQLTALTLLGLEGNALQQIEPGALEGLGRLEVLQLQDNQLQQLPTGLGGRGVGCGCSTEGRPKHETVGCNFLWGLSMECYWPQGSFSNPALTPDAHVAAGELHGSMPWTCTPAAAWVCVPVGDCSSLVAFNASHNALTALPDGVTRLGKLQVLAVDANK